MAILETTTSASYSWRKLAVISLPALGLAMAFGVNNPSMFHLVLTDFIEKGLLSEAHLNSTIGILGICGLITSTFIQPLIGSISDRTHTLLGRRYPYMLAGALLFAMAVLIEIYALNLVGLLVGVFLSYAALGMTQSPANALIPDIVPVRQMGLAAGLKTVLEMIGIMIGGVIVWLFLGESDNPVMAMVVMNLFLLGTIGMAVAFGPPKQLQCSPIKRRLSTNGRYFRRYSPYANRLVLSWRIVQATQKHIMRRHAFMWWLAHRICLFGAFGILGKFTITYLEDVFGFTDNEARALQGQLVVMLSVLIMGTPILAGMLSDRIGRQRLITFAGLLAAISTFFVSQTRVLEVAIVLMAVTGIGTSILFSVGWALVTSLIPTRQAAFYMGITNVATSAGTMLGLSAGLLVDAVNMLTDSKTQGYMVILICAAVLYLLSALTIYYSRETSPASTSISPATIPKAAL